MNGNIYAELPTDFTNEIFEPLLQTPSLLLERIISYGQTTPEDEWYDQEKDEWVMLLSGSAGVRIESEPDIIELKPGDYLLLPAHQRHRVEWTSATEKTIWLALHFRKEQA